MFYVRRGEVPPKRHTQFRQPDGSLYAEELFGVEGFRPARRSWTSATVPTRRESSRSGRSLSRKPTTESTTTASSRRPRWNPAAM